MTKPNFKAHLPKPPRPTNEPREYSWILLERSLTKRLKDWRICLARFWQTRKAEEEGAHGFQSKDATEDQDPSQDGRQLSCGQGRKGWSFGGKEVVKEVWRWMGRRLATDSALVRSLAQCSRYSVPVLVPPPWFPVRYGWIQMILRKDDRGPCACDFK